MYYVIHHRFRESDRKLIHLNYYENKHNIIISIKSSIKTMSSTIISVSFLNEKFSTDIFLHIMKYIGRTPSAKALKHTCDVYNYYKKRYLHFEDALCSQYLYSYLHFRPHPYLTQENHYDLLYADWLTIHPNIKDEEFIKKYDNSYIYYENKSIEDGNIHVMDFIVDHDIYLFIIACMYCEFVSNSTTFRQTYDIGITYEFCDLLYDFQMEQQKVLLNLLRFRMGEFEKIHPIFEFMINNDSDDEVYGPEYADDNSYGSWG